MYSVNFLNYKLNSERIHFVSSRLIFSMWCTLPTSGLTFRYSMLHSHECAVRVLFQQIVKFLVHRLERALDACDAGSSFIIYKGVYSRALNIKPSDSVDARSIGLVNSNSNDENFQFAGKRMSGKKTDTNGKKNLAAATAADNMQFDFDEFCIFRWILDGSASHFSRKVNHKLWIGWYFNEHALQVKLTVSHYVRPN